MIDSGQHSVRLYTTAADSPIVLQRPDGSFEKQYRQYSAGKLPVAYRFSLLHALTKHFQLCSKPAESSLGDQYWQ